MNASYPFSPALVRHLKRQRRPQDLKVLATRAYAVGGKRVTIEVVDLPDEEGHVWIVCIAHRKGLVPESIRDSTLVDLGFDPETHDVHEEQVEQNRVIWIRSRPKKPHSAPDHDDP